MTCYMRHMADLFEVLGIENDAANRRCVDGAIRSVLGLEDGSHCPQVWSAIKALSDERRAELPALVARELDPR